MKAKDVLNILNISRPTLKRYREKGILKATLLPTGHYDFDEDSVYLLKNKNEPRINVIYARVSTCKQKKDLANQIVELKDFMKAKGFELNNIYQDVASGISFEKRKQFFKMLDLILQGKVKRVVISHKDRLSRVGFDLFKYLFDKYGTEIIVVSDVANPKTDEQELFEEIISLLHCFSMRMYSHRRSERKKIEEVINAHDDKC